MSHRRKFTSPSFQFYPQDYLAGTCGLSLAAQGLYWRLCSLSWAWGGPLPLDHETLIRATGATPQEWAQLWPEIAAKFKQLKTGYINGRLERTRVEAREFRDSRAKASQLGVEARRRKSQRAAPPPDDLAASQAEYAQNPPSVEPSWVLPPGTPMAHGGALGPASTPSREVYESRTTNPHHKPTNLINGADLRRHGQHAWCSPRDGLCVPRFLHQEFLGKSNKPELEIIAFYQVTLANLNGHAVGEDALVFWRNTFAGWVGTVTASPDTSSRQARNNADARKTLTEIRDGTRKSITQVVRELAARPAIAAKPS